MQVYVLLNAAGLPQAFYDDVVFPPIVTYGEAPEPTEDDPNPVPPIVSTAQNPGIPSSAIEISDAVRQDVLANPGHRQWNATSGAFVPFEPPAPDPGPVRVLKLDIWRRTTDAEAVALVQLLGAQTVRLQRMFNDATVISSADELWPTLQGAVVGLFGADRAAVLLAAS